jgi:hypothetical protein
MLLFFCCDLPFFKCIWTQNITDIQIALLPVTSCIQLTISVHPDPPPDSDVLCKLAHLKHASRARHRRGLFRRERVCSHREYAGEGAVIPFEGLWGGFVSLRSTIS